GRRLGMRPRRRAYLLDAPVEDDRSARRAAALQHGRPRARRRRRPPGRPRPRRHDRHRPDGSARVRPRGWPHSTHGDWQMIKVKDLAYGRLRSPDLDAAEEFLTHFGMIRAARTPTALYMRGTDPMHHLHVTEKGDPKFVGLAYYATSEEDLRRVAKAPGASEVEAIDEPGGGRRVRLREPNGYQIEVVYGIEALPAIPVPEQHMNSGAEPLRRAGTLMRLRG